MTSTLPLSGIRVLDLGRLFAAPWCGQTLGDLGAEVIKVERPGTGDDMRQYGPPWLTDKAGAQTQQSSYFTAANRNKRSIAIDFTREEGRAVIRRLAAQCDVVIENFRPGTLARYGLDYPQLQAINPEIIYCSVTGFGPTGPYAGRSGVDGVFQAMSGIMSVTGDPKGDPQRIGFVAVDLVTGLYAAIAILAALRHREVNGGTGQRIDLCLLDTAVTMLSHRAMEFLMTGTIPERVGTASIGATPAGVFTCADGRLIQFQAGSNLQFQRLCKALDKPEWLADPRFCDRAARVANREELVPIVRACIARWPRHDLLDAFTANDVFCAPVNDVAEAFADPQVVHNRVEQHSEHPTYGDCPGIASPIRFSGTPIGDFRAPPTLGEHTLEVLADFDFSDDEIAQLRSGKIVAAQD